MSRLILAPLALAAALTGGLASAHHSFAVFFDDKQEVTLRGTVTMFRFTNPHGTLAFDVRGPDGKVQHWRAETNAPSVLQRRGWNRGSVRPGQVITIKGWRARDGSRYIRMGEVRDAEGNLVGGRFGTNDD
ncbi:DUF6152 family protein [Aurantiacibacter suaedae]|uniref:DUF6152 family protein n=1 Tax=Aurantiacibacter suaedae TaxID=2545755 RepID=UPI0010F8C5C8|nr:DUF6152 family protein [Aurantiacibacter suaedae]